MMIVELGRRVMFAMRLERGRGTFNQKSIWSSAGRKKFLFLKKISVVKKISSQCGDRCELFRVVLAFSAVCRIWFTSGFFSLVTVLGARQGHFERDFALITLYVFCVCVVILEYFVM